MLFIDFDHDPVNGLSTVSKALGKFRATNRLAGIPYECVDYLWDSQSLYSCIPTINMEKYFCQDANHGMWLVQGRFQP